MPWLFRLLTLFALLVAPLTASAAAIVPGPATAADCAKMEMSASHRPIPTDHHRAGEPCCVAVPAAIDPPLTAVSIEPLLDHPTFIAAAEPFLLGAGPKADDPPPRRT